MKISIVTATWNSGATVRDTIESVLAQTYPDIEYIVVDGGSKDNTMDIVKEYEPRFGGRMRWVSEPDHGIYDAMNKGIRMATGDVVGILNSDDFYYDNSVVEDIANAFNKAEIEIKCVYGNLIFVDPNDTSIMKRRWIGSQYRKGGFFRGWHPAHPTFYAMRACFDEAGDFDLTFDVSADFELMLRFIEKHGYENRYIPRYFVKMRLGGESTGSISKIMQGNRNVLRAFEKNGFKKPHFYLIRRLAPKAWDMVKTKFTRK